MPLFVVVSGEDDASVFPIDGKRCVLGKSPSADMQLGNPYVSRAHAEVVAVGGRYQLRDLGSKNGTSLNGESLGPEGRWLSEGDRVELAQGQVVLRYRSGTSTITLDLGAPDGPVRVDSRSREVYVAAERIQPPLSRKEFDVLRLLYERRGQACSKDEIAEAGWPDRGGDVSDEEIEQCVRRIRLRIEAEPSHPRVVKTVRGYGYKIETS
ncbi:MAG: winged helix-turn-helix domain-containing protein [Chloroflexi bacterium]|nr:winged helix-turn-helix domain-containing protein [Chloroflexota bacterium]